MSQDESVRLRKRGWQEDPSEESVIEGLDFDGGSMNAAQAEKVREALAKHLGVPVENVSPGDKLDDILDRLTQ